MQAKLIFSLLLCCTPAAWAQSSTPQQGGPSQDAQAKPAVSGQVPQPASPDEVPAVHLLAGSAVFLKIIEPAAKWSWDEIPFRNSDEVVFNKLTNEFAKRNRFHLVDRVSDAEVVFFVVRYWTTTLGLGYRENDFALAVPRDDYMKNVAMLSPLRGVAHVTAMLPSALWSSEKHYNLRKGAISLGNRGRANPVDLVKEFCHDAK